MVNSFILKVFRYTDDGRAFSNDYEIPYQSILEIKIDGVIHKPKNIIFKTEDVKHLLYNKMDKLQHVHYLHDQGVAEIHVIYMDGMHLLHRLDGCSILPDEYYSAKFLSKTARIYGYSYHQEDYDNHILVKRYLREKKLKRILNESRG